MTVVQVFEILKERVNTRNYTFEIHQRTPKLIPLGLRGQTREDPAFRQLSPEVLSVVETQSRGSTFKDLHRLGVNETHDPDIATCKCFPTLEDVLFKIVQPLLQ